MCDEHGCGCRCIACHTGKPHTKPNERAIELALTRVGYPAPLRIVQHDATTTTQRVTVCHGDPMVCECEKHQHERTALIRRGGIGNGNASPFKRAA